MKQLLNDNAMKIAKILRDSGYEVYVVGGAVRDFVLDLEPHDIDFATNATPDEVEQIMKKNGVFTTDVGKKYGTIVSYEGGEEFEVTTYRKDGAILDGRHPDGVTFASSIEEDLSRRDFTMNAMAMDPFTNKIIDPFGGMQDMRNKMIAFVGKTQDRINEDALRMIRACRFAIKYGYELSLQDMRILKKNAHLCKNVSNERKTEELKKILTCGKPIYNVFLSLPEMMFQIIPELEPTFKCTQNNKYHWHDIYDHCLFVTDGAKTDKFEIKLACLLHDIGKPESKVPAEQSDDGYEHFYGHPKVSARIVREEVFKNSLVLTNKEKEQVGMLVELHDTNLFYTEKQLRKAVVKYGEPFLRDLLVLQTSDRLDHIFPPNITQEKLDNWFTPMEKIEEMLARINEQLNCFSLKDLAVNGRDLIALGYEGKEIGATLNAMLDAVVEGTVENDKDTLLSTFTEDKTNECGLEDR